jgi:putative ABC transport system permease protein
VINRKIHLMVLRDILARRYQFGALMLIVGLGIATYVCLSVAFGNIGRSYDRTYRETHFADFTVSVEGAPASVVNDVQALPNVERAEGRQVIDTGLIAPGDRFVQARLIGVPTDRRPAVNDVVLESGRYFQPGDTNAVLPVRAFADFYGLKSGDTLRAYTGQGLQELTVVGVVSSPEYLILAESKQDLLASPRRFGVFFLPEARLEQLFDKEGEINEVDVVVADENSREETISAVDNVLAPYGLKLTTRSEDQPSRAGTELDLEGGREFATLLPALILVVGAFAIYIAMSRLVRAQRTIVGLFRAVGYGTAAVVGHYLLIAAVVAVIGALGGIVAGYSLSYLLTNAYASALKIPLVTNEFQPMPIVVSVLVSLVVALVAAALPAWSAARLLPAPAMRPAPEVALAKGSVPLFERVLGLGRRPPMLLRLALRNVWRTPRRMLYTVGAISLALLLLVVGFSTFDSMNFTLDKQFERTDRWDLAAVFASPRSADRLKEIEAIDGVATAEPIYFAPAELRAGSDATNVELVALTPDQRLHGFDLKGGGQAAEALGQGGIILPTGVADKLGVGRGDVLDISTDGQTASLTVAGVSREAVGGLAYVSMQTKEGALGLPAGFNGVFLDTTSTSVNQSVQAALYDTANAEAVQIKDEMRSDWHDVMGLFNVMVWFVVVFCIVMAAAIIFNTMTVNVLEREREIATIRTLGSGVPFVASTLLTEGLALSLLAVAPGLVLGTLAASYLMTAFNSEFFSLFFHVTTRTYVIVSLLVVATALLSTLPAIRHCNRMNLAEATKVIT